MKRLLLVCQYDFTAQHKRLVWSVEVVLGHIAGSTILGATFHDNSRITSNSIFAVSCSVSDDKGGCMIGLLIIRSANPFAGL